MRVSISGGGDNLHQSQGETLEELLKFKRKLSGECSKNVDEEDKLIRSIDDLEHMRFTKKHHHALSRQYHDSNC